MDQIDGRIAPLCYVSKYIKNGVYLLVIILFCVMRFNQRIDLEKPDVQPLHLLDHLLRRHGRRHDAVHWLGDDHLAVAPAVQIQPTLQLHRRDLKLLAYGPSPPQQLIARIFKVVMPDLHPLPHGYA